MFRRFSTSFALLSMFLDGILVVLSLYLAALIRPVLNRFSFIITMPAPVELPGVVFLFAVIVWIGVMLFLGVYDGRKNYRVIDEFSSVVISSLLAGVSLAGVLYLSYREVSRALFATFFILALTSLLSWRVIARLIFRRNATLVPARRRVLVVGSGPLAQAVGGQILAYANLGWVLAGYLADADPSIAKGDEVLGPLSEARRVVSTRQIDDIVITLPPDAHETTNWLLAEVGDLAVKIWAVPDYFNLAVQQAQYENFAGLAMLDLQLPALSDYQRLLKRLVDLFITVVCFLPALVVMGLIALVIRLESHAPAVFKQVRVGENGKLFNMYKFRTMVPDAENLRHLVETTDADGNLLHKPPDDPRVTRFGRILRRTSLDELPQLWNILKGEMSLVGPRPELPFLVDRYQPWQRRRLGVPQGLTGWWQVNGRSDKPMHLHTEDDLYYIQHYSLGLDLKILMMTVIAVLRGRGAF